MALRRVALDTDILSAIMRRHPSVIPTARAYLIEHHQSHFSVVTQYETLRGLKARDAVRQTTIFEDFCSRNIILYLGGRTVSKAAEIYADLYKRGGLIGDADILIAACAMVNGLGVVTNNEKHFRRISDLHVENWLK